MRKDESSMQPMDESSMANTHAPWIMVQMNMEKVATSIETMSKAWQSIADARCNDTNELPPLPSKTKKAKTSESELFQVTRKPSPKHSYSNPRVSESENADTSNDENGDDDADDDNDSDDSPSEAESQASDAASILNAASRTKSVQKEAPEGTNERASLMETVAQEFVANDKGPNVSDSVAKTINERWANKMDAEMLKKKMHKYPAPENCISLNVPRVNTPVWNTLDRYYRGQDIRLCNIQNLCVAAGSAVTKCLDDLVTSDKVDVPGLIRQLTDSVVLLGQANYDLSLRRRDTMRPALSSDYRGICNADNPVTHLLYGEDLQKDLKNVKENQKLGKELKKKQYNKAHKSYKQKRYRPYSKQGGNFHKSKNYKARNKRSKARKSKKQGQDTSDDE